MLALAGVSRTGLFKATRLTGREAMIQIVVLPVTLAVGGKAIAPVRVFVR